MAAEDSDIEHIDGGFKLLTSTDIIVQNLAWNESVETANWRQNSTSHHNMQAYLNSAESVRTSDKYKSLWSRARQVSKKLGVKRSKEDISPVEIRL